MDESHTFKPSPGLIVLTDDGKPAMVVACGDRLRLTVFTVDGIDVRTVPAAQVRPIPRDMEQSSLLEMVALSVELLQKRMATLEQQVLNMAELMAGPRGPDAGDPGDVQPPPPVEDAGTFNLSEDAGADLAAEAPRGGDDPF